MTAPSARLFPPAPPYSRAARRRSRPTRAAVGFLVALGVVASSVVATVVIGASVARADPGPVLPTTLPLQEFVADHANGRVWNAYNLTWGLSGPTLLSNPTSLSDPGDGFVHVFDRTTNNDLIQYVSDGHTPGQVWSAYDITQQAGGSPPINSSADGVYYPVTGQLHVYAQGQNGHLLEFVDTNASPHQWSAWDLTAAAWGGIPMTGGAHAVYFPGDGRIHIYTEGSNGHLIEYINDNVGGHLWNAWDLTAASVGTTVLGSEPSADYYAGDGRMHIYARSSAGHMVEVVDDGYGGRLWNEWDLTAASGTGPLVSGTPDAVFDAAHGLQHIYDTDANNHVVEYVNGNVGGHLWNAWDLTVAGGPGAPGFAGGARAVYNPGDRLMHVYGRVGNNDMVEYSDGDVGGRIWNAADVTAGANGPTIGSDPAPVVFNNAVHVYGGGPMPPGGPARTGVGVYGFASWSAAAQAINDGWPVLGDTGGLGTLGPPYTAQLSANPDQNVGSAIDQTRVRVTWLSFWTVSGPANGQSNCGGTAPMTSDTWYSAGVQGGQTAARSLDHDYLATANKPDWVILDPEGCNADWSALTSQNWNDFIGGWWNGVKSVDPTLQPAFYVSQSQYASGHLSTIAMPAFIAVSPILGNTPFKPSYGFGAPGNNVYGYIAYGDFSANPPQPNCPASPYETTIRNWGAPYNTLQFPDSGVDCGP